MTAYSKLSALLTAANTKTGESDTTLTDAIQTLIDGYGQGGSSVQTATGTFTGNGAQELSITCSFAPDLVVIERTKPLATLTERVFAACVMVRYLNCAYSNNNANSTVFSTYLWQDLSTRSSGYPQYWSYANGALKTNTFNNATLYTTQSSYTYHFYKWTT